MPRWRFNGWLEEMEFARMIQIDIVARGSSVPHMNEKGHATFAREMRDALDTRPREERIEDDWKLAGRVFGGLGDGS